MCTYTIHICIYVVATVVIKHEILLTVSFWVILGNPFAIDVLYDSLVFETSIYEVLCYVHVILGKQ